MKELREQRENAFTDLNQVPEEPAQIVNNKNEQIIFNNPAVRHKVKSKEQRMSDIEAQVVLENVQLTATKNQLNELKSAEKSEVKQRTTDTVTTPQPEQIIVEEAVGVKPEVT